MTEKPEPLITRQAFLEEIAAEFARNVGDMQKPMTMEDLGWLAGIRGLVANRYRAQLDASRGSRDDD